MKEKKYRAWDNLNKVMKHYTLKQLVDEDLFNYHTEIEAIQSGYDNWIWLEYTGLTDKNGVEIYEGDIIQLWGNRPIQIEYDGEKLTAYRYQPTEKAIIKTKPGSFVADELRGSDSGWYFGILDHSSVLGRNNIEVIGNIHGNPELLNT